VGKPSGLGGKFPIILIMPLMALLIFITAFPLVYSTFLSLTDYNLAMEKFNFVGLSNFQRMVNDERFVNSIQVTFTFVAGSVTLEFIGGMILALLLNREFRARNIILSLILAPAFLAPVVVGYVWKYMASSEYGIINYLAGTFGLGGWLLLGPELALFTCILADVWQWSSFIMAILLAGLESLPRDFYEAAETDGASGWQQFRHLTFPLLKPMILVALIIRTIDSFKAFDVMYVLTAGGPGTVTEVATYYIYNVALGYGKIGYGMAMSWILLIIMTILGNVYLRILPTEKK